MLIIKDAPIFGQQSGTGLIVPSAVVLGNGGNQPDYSPIDMTSATPDRRIRYQCASSHAVYGQDGLIYFAGPDECPVEYIDGVAVGRHEPEPQRTNLVISNMTNAAWATSNMSVAHATDDFYTIAVTATVDPFIQCNAVVTPGQTVTNSIFLQPRSTFVHRNVRRGQTGVSDDVVFNFLTGTITKSSAEITSARMSTVNGLSQTVSTYTTNASLTQYQMRLMLARPTNTVGDSGIIEYPQCEIGETRTSPIKASATPTTRGASFLLVEMQGAAGIRVRYTTGEFDEYPATGDAWFPLPWSTNDWGTRYIQQIEYIS